MGAIHSPIPLTEVIKDDEGCEWLELIGISIPDANIWSKRPTHKELLTIIHSIKNYDIDDEDPTYITVTDKFDQRWTTLVFFKDAEKVDIPQDFYFHKGDDEFVIEIMNLFSPLCGYYLLLINAEDPVLITPK
jgi:hypothetical protein